MVEPSWLSRTSRLAILGLAGPLLTGCSLVPRSRLDDCHKLSRTLEADKARLNDAVLSLRAQNSDLAQRGDDDARRLLVRNDEIKRLRASVQAYQEERDQLASDYARVKSLLQVSANPVSTSLLERFEGFAKGRPGCEFDAASGILTLSSDALFEPGGDRLLPSAQPLLQALADLLVEPGAGALRMRVSGHTDESPVRQASFREGDGEDSAGGRLSLDRAARVRDQLTRDADVDPARIEVAGFEASAPLTEGLDDASRTRNRRIEIQLFAAAWIERNCRRPLTSAPIHSP